MKWVGIAAYIATSIDGYIAKCNGDIDWLNLASDEDEDYGFRGFLEKVDTVVLGRKTYEVALRAYQTSEWPYDGKRLIVLSNTLQSVIDEATLMAKDVGGLVEGFCLDPAIKNVWIDGGQVISQFLDGDMLDEITISVIPTILGEGVSLFTIKKEAVCSLIDTKAYPSGVIQVKYKING